MIAPPPCPILAAFAHGAGACGIVMLVAALWTWLPGRPDATTALLTVAVIGGLSWLAAGRARRRRRAANDNVASPSARFDWTAVEADLSA